MNATKFVVLIVIGVVCANVISAIRQPEGVSKESKFGISDPKTATTNGVGAELNVDISSDIYESDGTSAYAQNRNGRTASNYGGNFFNTGGIVNATGRNTRAISASGGAGNSNSAAGVTPRSSKASGSSNSGNSTTSSGIARRD